MQDFEFVTEAEVIAAGKFVGFANVPEEVYRPAPYYSQSFLTEVRRSPAHAQASKQNPKEPTPDMLLGTYAHCAILEPERFEEHFVIGPDVSRATKEWKAFVAEHPNDTILKPDEFETINQMFRAVMAHPEASRLLTGGQSEHSAFWIDPISGLRCKARYDYVHMNKGIIVDLKTTKDASQRAFERSCVDRGYHRQSAFYLDGFNLLTGQQTDMFVHVLVEKEPPYAVGVYVLDNGALDKGRHEILQLLETVKQCEKSGKWPAYSDRIQAATLPPWAWNE